MTSRQSWERQPRGKYSAYTSPKLPGASTCVRGGAWLCLHQAHPLLPTMISHSVFKTETFILNTTKMWHRAQARHLFQQNVMFWSFSKMIFLFLKKVCAHGDESVSLRGTVCWVILKAAKFKNTRKKIIFLKYYFNFILWLSIFSFFNLSIASNSLSEWKCTIPEGYCSIFIIWNLQCGSPVLYIGIFVDFSVL